jgi:hypothetical protein
LELFLLLAVCCGLCRAELLALTMIVICIRHVQSVAIVFCNGLLTKRHDVLVPTAGISTSFGIAGILCLQPRMELLAIMLCSRCFWLQRPDCVWELLDCPCVYACVCESHFVALCPGGILQGVQELRLCWHVAERPRHRQSEGSLCDLLGCPGLGEDHTR